MAAVVAGNSLGLVHSSLYVLGSLGVLGQSTHGRGAERIYVNAATGNLVVQRQDELLVGRGPDVGLLRTYNSQGSFNDDNGDNWRLGVYKKVYNLTGTVNTVGSTVTRVDGDGAEAVFTYDPGLGAYVSKAGSGAYDQLTYNAGTQVWTWTDGATQVKELYDGANGGRITQIQDPDGNSLTFTYNGGLITQVADASGETTELVYDGNLLIQLRTVKSGGAVTRVHYSYDDLDRLWQVTTDLSPEDNSVADNNTYVITYTYDGTSKRIASLTQTDGQNLSFTYVQVNGAWKVQTITDALGRTTRFAYGTMTPSVSRVDVTDPLGLVTSLYYDTAGQLITIETPAVGGTRFATRFAYDSSGNVTQVTDARGNAVTYGYDASGNRILERDAAGNTIERVFGSKNELLNEISYLVPDPDGAGVELPDAPQTTRHVYDAENHLRFVVGAEGRVSEYRYNGFGQRTAAIQYTAATYDVSNLSAADTLTEGQLTAWLPDNRSKSIRTDTTYDFRGQVSRTTTYAVVNSAGNGIGFGTQSVTQYVYDQAGNLLKVIDPRGFFTSDPNDYTTTYVYDGLGRVLSTTDALGRVSVNQYDDANRKTVLTLANALVRTSTYSAAGELLSVFESASGQTLGETKYFYDADGRLRRTEDPTGVKAHVLYDQAGRTIGSIDGDGTLTEYRYNQNGQLTKTIRYATAVSAANLASLIGTGGAPTTVTLGAIRPASALADRITWNVYDGANRLVKSVDELGYVTQSFYDGAGRLTDVVAFATAIATAGLPDAPTAAQVNPTSGSSDRLTRSFYDGEGRLLAILDPEGYLVEQLYDAAGQLTQTIAYSTATPVEHRTSGTLDQLRPASHTQDINSYTLYNARGQVVGTVDGERYLTEFVYDLAGNKTRAIRYSTRVTYTPGQSLVATRPAPSAQDQVFAYSYTELHQLASETNPEGTLTQYTYDEVGNLIKTVRAVNTLDERGLNAQYDKQGRLTAELAGKGSAQLLNAQNQEEIDAIWAAWAIKHTYDAAGRRTSTTDPEGNKTLFYYDADGRLTHTINALGEVRRSIYNALGDLVRSIDYGTRLSSGTLATLTGGLADSTLKDAILEIANAARDSQTSYTYTKRGELGATTDPLGFITSRLYDAFGDAVSRSQQLSVAQTLDHTYAYDKRGLLTQTVWDPSGINTVASTRYDAFGRATQTTDPRGNVRTQTYDKLGRVVTTVDPLNKTRSFTYDAFGRVLTQTDPLNNATTFAYDTATRSVTVTTPEGVVATTVTNRHGETFTVTDGRGNTTTYDYDKHGNLIVVVAPVVGLSYSIYDKADRISEAVDANGNRTTYTYDAANRVLTRTVDPGDGHLNLVTTYAYDAKGQMVTVTDANGVVTQTEFDLKGQVTRVSIDPTGLNLRTAYTYDGRGKTLTVTEGEGSVQPRITQYIYDKLGRRTEEHIDPSGINATTTYAYDKNDNVVTRTDALGNLTRYVYDANDRLIYAVDALGGVIANEYDDNGRLTKTTAHAVVLRELGTLPSAPSLSDITSRLIPSSNDQRRYHVYDRDGRERYTITALRNVLEKIYDPNGNVLRIIAYANAITVPATLTPASIAAALSPSPTEDRVSFTVYDAANRAVYAIDALGYVEETQYDNVGRITKTIQYANPLMVGLAGDPTIAEVKALLVPNAAADQMNSFLYDAAGRLIESTDAEGFTERFGYDAVGNKTAFINKKGAIWFYEYDNNRRLTLELSPGVEILTVTEDASGNLVTQTTSDSIETYIEYDALGNVLSRTEAYHRPEARTTAYQYDALGRQIATVFPAVKVYANDDLTTNGTDGSVERTEITVLPTVNVTFDAFGNATVNRDAAGNYSYKVYDVLGRVKYEIDAERHVTVYFYDTFGNQVALRRHANPLNFGAHTEGTPFSLAEVANGIVGSSRDRTITTQYDKLNRATQVTEPAAYNYDPSAPTGSQYFTTGRRTRNTYDAFGQVIKQSIFRNPGPDAVIGNSDDRWADTYFYYDRRGARTAQVDALGYLTTWEYDETGDLEREVQYAQALQAGTWSTASYGTPTTTTPQVNPAGALGYDRETIYQYDRKNQKIAEARVNVEFGHISGALNLINLVGSLTTSYGYDAVGNLTRVTDPNGASTYTYYDALGRVVATAEPARFSDGASGAVSMAPVALAYDPATNAGTLSFANTAPADTTVALRYKVVGGATWTVASLTLNAAGTTYSVALTGLPSDRYQYELTHTRAGENTPYATGTGAFSLLGPTSVTSTHVVATVERPTLAFSVDKSAGGADLSSWSKDNSISASWNSLNALGNGNVRVKLTYLTWRFEYVGDLIDGRIDTFPDGETRSREQVFSAAAAATGATFSWEEFAGIEYGGVQAIERVEAWKVVDGTEIKVIDSTTPYSGNDRLLIRGKTAGLTGINVAGVGTLGVTSLGAGVYTASLDLLARKSYTFTPVGTSSAVGGSFEVLKSAVAGNAGLQEIDAASANRRLNAFNLPAAAASAVLEYRVNGDSGPFLSRPMTLVAPNSGQFTADYQGIANGSYRFRIVVRDAGGALLDLTSVGGTSNGMLIGTIEIKRGAQSLPAVTAAPNALVLTPLTSIAHDAFGNVTRTTRHAKGTASADASGFLPASADAADQTSYNAYDSHGHLIHARDPEGGSEYSAYDVLGRVAKTWQPVTNHDGIVNNAVQVFQYDKLGRQTATIEPSYLPNQTLAYLNFNVTSRASWQGFGSGTPAHWNGTNALSIFWNEAGNGGPGDVQVEVYYTRTLVQWYPDEREGYYVEERGSAAVERRVYSSVTGAIVSWDDDQDYEGGIWSIDRVVVSKQQAGGAWKVIHDRTLSGAYATGTPPLDPAGYATTQAQYNAFGEITAKGLNDGWQEYYQYDNAGRLWRTNDQDGVAKVYLYDVQGKATADIKSMTRDLASAAYPTAASVAVLTSDVIRTDTHYDLLGRVTKQVQPTFYVPAGVEVIDTPLTYPQMAVNFTVQSQATWQHVIGGVYAWLGDNVVNVSWNEMASWGPGEISVDMYYLSTEGNSDGTINPGFERMKSVRLAAGATSASFVWRDEPPTGAEGGIWSLIRVVVYKQDATGVWKVIHNPTSGGASVSGRTIVWQKPAQVGVQAQFKYKATSSGTWSAAAILDMGSSFVVDTRRFGAGTYDYELLYTRPGETVPYAHATGQFTLGGTESLTQTTQPATILGITPVLQQTLDRWGNAISVTDPRGNVTDYRYNQSGRLVEEKRPQVDVWAADGTTTPARPTTRNYYDRLDRGLGTIDPNGNTTAARYDAAGQRVAEYHADGGVVYFRYDALGRRTRVIDPNGNATNSFYDRNDRLIREQRPIGEDNYAYDQAGNRIRVTDPTGLVTKYWYDTRGKLIRTRLSGGQETYAYYDLRGNKIREVNANYDQPAWAYDYFGRLTGHVDLGNASYSYTYNNAGQLTAQSNTRGQSLGYTYYENGALKQIDDTGRNVNTETYYEYDDAGNRTRERFTKDGTIHQDNVITFDLLNRISKIHDNRYTITYKYDANGNRRNIHSDYVDNDNTTRKIVDNWYLYDRMNRITLSQGVLNGGKIQLTTAQGVELEYDAAGNRRVASTLAAAGLKVSERYDYDANNRLTTISRGGELSSRAYDAAGRVTETISYSSPGVISERRVATYHTPGVAGTTLTGLLKEEKIVDGSGNPKQTTTYTGYDGLGNVTNYQISIHTGTPYTNFYRYAYAKYETYKENVVSGSSTHFQPGNTTTSYDVNGNITRVDDRFATNRTRTFLTDGNGRILQKTEDAKTQYYFYANDKPIGSSGALAPADFDYNYTPVSAQYPAPTPGTYVVSEGDTLRSIALAVFGDAQLWFVIADANGISDDTDLKVGQQITIPNRITNLHNDSGTFKVFDPSKVIGDTTPTLPDPPPLPQPSSKNKCGGLGIILVAVVAAVATVVTAGAVLTVIAPSLAASVSGGIFGAGLAALSGSAGLAGVAAAAVGGAVGSIASQGVGIAIGLQEKFSWAAVATSGIGAGVSAGVGVAFNEGGIAANFLKRAPVARAALQSVASGSITQGLNIAVGLQSKFDWRSVAASAIAAPVTQKVGGFVNRTAGKALGVVAGDFLGRVTGGVIGQAAEVLVHRGGTIAIASVVGDAFGNVIANAAAGVYRSVGQQEQALQEAESEAPASSEGVSLDDLSRPELAELQLTQEDAVRLLDKLYERAFAIESSSASPEDKEAAFRQAVNALNEINRRSTAPEAEVHYADAGGGAVSDAVPSSVQANSSAFLTGLAAGIVTGAFDDVKALGELTLDVIRATIYIKVFDGRSDRDFFGGPKGRYFSALAVSSFRQSYDDLAELGKGLHEIATNPSRLLDAAKQATGAVRDRIADAANRGDWFAAGQASGELVWQVASVLTAVGALAGGAVKTVKGLRAVLKAATVSDAAMALKARVVARIVNSERAAIAKGTDAASEVPTLLRRGLGSRTDADFHTMGQLYEGEYNSLGALSEQTRFKFGIAGGHAENRIGLTNRSISEFQKRLPWWRRGPPSRLSDVDVWVERGASFREMLDLGRNIRTILPGKRLDFKYSIHIKYQADLWKHGVIVFDRGVPQPIRASWQRVYWRHE